MYRQNKSLKLLKYGNMGIKIFMIWGRITMICKRTLIANLRMSICLNKAEEKRDWLNLSKANTHGDSAMKKKDALAPIVKIIRQEESGKNQVKYG